MSNDTTEMKVAKIIDEVALLFEINEDYEYVEHVVDGIKEIPTIAKHLGDISERLGAIADHLGDMKK